MMTDIYIIRTFPSNDGNFLSLEIINRNEKEKFQILNSLIEKSNIDRHIEPCNMVKINDEIFDKIKKLSEYTKAITKGISLLSYSQNTVFGISKKLYTYGYSKEVCDFAGKYLKKHGYINEELQASLLCENLSYKKLYGQSRIEKELKEKGFPNSVIKNALDELDIDFNDICKQRIEKTIDISRFNDYSYKKKCIYRLRQYGFNMDNILSALEEI